ncbi:hypothetical protein V1477_017170 [Vespula maculifrons]|uniref:Uncharacterized protein n=1 Tax=Vespula maculifrons TaxID=7453 RepID=A0ABD2B598_VESMC
MMLRDRVERSVIERAVGERAPDHANFAFDSNTKAHLWSNLERGRKSWGKLRLTFKPSPGLRKRLRKARADAWPKGLRASRCKAHVPQIASPLAFDKCISNWHDTTIDVRQGLNT